MPGRVGQKSFVYVASEPYFLVSTLITPLHNKDLPAHHGGQPPEQDRSHENRNNRDSGGFCSGGCQKVSWDVAHTYIEVEFYRICNVEKFRPCNLSPGGQTPHSQPKRRARHKTVRIYVKNPRDMWRTPRQAPAGWIEDPDNKEKIL